MKIEAISKDDAKYLSRCFGKSSNLWEPQAQRVNEWLKQLIIAASEPVATTICRHEFETKFVGTNNKRVHICAKCGTSQGGRYA